MTDRNVAEERAVLDGPPKGYFVVVPARVSEDSIDLSQFVSLALRSWFLLLVTAVIGAAIAIAISFQFRSLYRAQATVTPVVQGAGGVGGSLRSQFGGIAALAGIDLSSGGDRKAEFFATLASTGYAREFIKSENLLPVLFAEQWDETARRWRDPSSAPTLEAGVKRFTEEVRTVTEDRRTSLVTVTIEWYSRELAAQWANRMVELVNERLRADAAATAARSLEYLNKEIETTAVVELRQSIYRLIESQINTAMIAKVQREFAFRFIDRAVPPEIRVFPRRSLFAVVGALGGFLLGFLIVLAVNAIRTRRAAPEPT
jgi:uncharacterized protein involved in exopolysaccharide biosynthesis